MRNKWTKVEEATLLVGVGSYGLSWFTDKAITGRSLNAIYAKARRLYGDGGLTRGAFTLNQICRMSGYSVCQFRRAMKALKQKWKKTSAKGSYLIQEEQYDEMLAWLAVDYWSKAHRLYRCTYCYRTDRVHRAYGLCEKCYIYYLSLLRSVQLPVVFKQLEIVIPQLKDKYPFLEKAEKNLKRKIAIEKDLLDLLYLCKEREKYGIEESN